MCIIALCTDKKLNDLQLWYCWTNNPDGAGMAWISPSGKHVLSKGYMTFPEFRAHYLEVDSFPHTVHFRTASSGLVIPSLTHPFVCNEHASHYLEWEGKEQLIFHNGIIHGWEMMARLFKIDPTNQYWSDTKLLSWILSKYSFEEIIKPEKTGRFVLLRGGEFFPHGKFEVEDGILFSNTGYKENLYEYYYLMDKTTGNRKKYRRKKLRNICHNRNGGSASSAASHSYVSGNSVELGI